MVIGNRKKINYKHMNYWMVKSEPEAYSFSWLVADKKTIWDGVRNFQARNNLKEMKKGDWVLYYHSGKEKQVVGIAEVLEEFFQDPSTDDANWVSVKLKPVEALKNPVTLQEIKANNKLSGMALIKQSRLSVLPLKKEEFDEILKMGSDK